MMRKGQLAQLLLVIFSFVSCLLLIRNKRTTFVITLGSNTQIYNMSKIIEQQREKIKYLSSHPKVVYQCLDEEPAYPKHASDELTDIMLSTNDECGNSSSFDAVLIVHTAGNHFEHRKQLRKLYGDYNYTKPYRLKVVFLLGSTLDANLQIQLEKENMHFGDTVVGSFLDTYRNLTLKAMMGFRWMTVACPKVKLLIKIDDDVVFDVFKFFTHYWHKVGNDRKQKSIHCLVWHNAMVARTGKWNVQRDLFANTSYPFPYCAGFFVVVSPDLIKSMYDYGKSVDFFWIDDVFLYGMVPAAIMGVHFVQLGGRNNFLTRSYAQLRYCREIHGRNACSIYASLTGDKSEFNLEYNEIIQQKSLLRRNITNPTAVN